MGGTLYVVAIGADVQGNRCAAYLAIFSVYLIASGEVDLHANFFATPGADDQLELQWLSHRVKIDWSRYPESAGPGPWAGSTCCLFAAGYQQHWIRRFLLKFPTVVRCVQ